MSLNILHLKKSMNLSYLDEEEKERDYKTFATERERECEMKEIRKEGTEVLIRLNDYTPTLLC